MSKVLTLLVILTVFAAQPGRAADAKNPAADAKIASLNLVSDEILIALEPSCPGLKARAWLSSLATDKRYAPLASEAASWKQSTTVESLASIRPTQAFASSYNKVEWIEQLRKQKSSVTMLRDTVSLQDVLENITMVGTASGCEAGAKSLRQSLEKTLKETHNSCRAASVMAIPEQGFVYGRGTLLDDMIAHLGLKPTVRELSIKGVVQLQAEAMATLKPDCLIASGTESDKATVLATLKKQAAWKGAPALASSCMAMVPGTWLSSGSQLSFSLLQALRSSLPACSPAAAAKTP